MALATLPTEILILVLYPLSALELSVLAQTSKRMHDLVYEFGWLQYIHSNPRPSYSLSAARKKWSPHSIVRYDTLADRAWTKPEFVARPLSRTWPAKEQSTLAISPSRLVVAAGAVLYSYAFLSNRSGTPRIALEGTIFLNETHIRGRNVTSLAFLDDGGKDQTLLVAYQEQLVERISLIKDGDALSFSRTPLPVFPKGDYIESFSASSSHVLSLSSNGSARLSLQHTLENRDVLSTLEIRERSWKSHLSLTSSTPFAAFGATGTAPFTVHTISQDEMSPTPSTILHTEKADPNNLSSSAVYGISQAPPNSPWGSPQVLTSGWFDGRVRIYDLRSPALSSTKEGTPVLTPVMKLSDRWSNEPIYSVSSGGGSGSHVAAGTARHSVVSFWDVRSPKAGWSVHAPGNDRSPVFGVALEGSRLFGVTEMRPFIYDFGPNATADCYPSISHGPRSNREGLHHKPGILSYRATRYRHASSGLADEF